MAHPSDRTPVIVGVGQWMQRDVEPAEALDPLSLMERAVRRAVDDSRAGAKLLDEIDAVAVPAILSWPLENPARLLAERLGCHPRIEMRSRIGGHMPQFLLNQAARGVRAGRHEVFLLAGAEAQYTVRRARRTGVALDWPVSRAPERILVGSHLPGSSAPEIAHGLTLPPAVYPLFENAIRARHGWSLDEHRTQLGALCERLSEVAARNPCAWHRRRRSAQEVVAVTPENRLIAFPYTKLMNACPDVDLAAAVVMTSFAKARALGIPAERLVYWWGGAEATEEPRFASERERFCEAPALGRAAWTALAQAGVDAAELECFDFYSCFPSAVRIACEELGIRTDDPRPLTTTGGLPYAGGPWNNYGTHAAAALTETLRAQPGARSLVTGVGWYLTEHAAGVYASAPPPPARAGKPEVSLPSEKGWRACPVDPEPNGAGSIETYTVLYARDGTPERGIVLGRLANGRRFLANTPDDHVLLEELASREAVGRRGRVRAGSPVCCFFPD